MAGYHELFSGVWPASTIPFNDDGNVLFDAFADHCVWLVDSGCRGVVVNGSLGEYEALSASERRRVVETAVEAVGEDRVIPGVAGRTAHESKEWAEQAAAFGLPAVLCLPPTSHAPTELEVTAHFSHVADAGVPIIAYNNPFSTRVDLTPGVLERLNLAVPSVFAVKEFSQDARRVPQILDRIDGFQVICGCDDVLLESILLGAQGWIAGFVNAFPQQSVYLYDLAIKGDWQSATELYREMLPIMAWDADPRFVQAIKLGQEIAGRIGGPVRLPRLPLSDDDFARARADAERALAAGLGAGL